MTSRQASSRAGQQHLSAIARTAAKVALRDSAESVLSAMAIEIRETEGIAGSQIILVGSATGSTRMMGSAGFSEDDGFFDLLMACHHRGAPLATYEALRTGSQRVYPDRKAEMLADDRWQPLHDYISELEWRDFVSTPFRLEGVTGGVINAYLGQSADRAPAICEFLQSMADQPALTLDYQAVTGYTEIEYAHAALAAGAVGYVLKDATPDQVEQAIRRAAGGGVYLDPFVAGGLTTRMVAGTGLAALTEQERNVLALVAKGLSNREIGARLSISESTVRSHMGGVLAKLGLTSRTQAALFAVREGLVRLNEP